LIEIEHSGGVPDRTRPGNGVRAWKSRVKAFVESQMAGAQVLGVRTVGRYDGAARGIIGPLFIIIS
jgi:hypothetical protein